MNRILGRAVYQLLQCKMRQVEANLKANLAVEASGQVAAGMRMNTQSKILYTRQYLQVREAKRLQHAQVMPAACRAAHHITLSVSMPG